METYYEKGRNMTVNSVTGATNVYNSSKIKEKETQEAQAQKSVKASEDSQVESSTAATSEEIKAEIEALEKEKEQNIQKMERLEQEIEVLAKDAQEEILEAAKQQEAAVEEHEEESKKVLDDNIAAYIAANKEGGEGMSKDQLESNIKNSMPDNSKIAAALAKLTAASKKIGEIDGLLESLNFVISDTKNIESDIETKQGEYDTKLAAEQEAAKCCDPIGFTLGEGENQVRYDFIVDDGSFDSTSDFLGADNQWAEMKDLDKDGSGIVSVSELQGGNIKMVKTMPDGTQKIVDIKEEFGEDFSIDLSSYKEGGSHSAIDTAADFDNDGVKDQQLLGTFNVNVNGEEIQGYNTLDDVDYLSEQYGVEAYEYSDDLAPHANFFSEYSAKSAELKTSLKEGLVSLGLSEESIEEITKETIKEGKEEANIFLEQLEKEQAEQEAKEAQEQEAKEAQETKEAQEQEELEKEEKEEKEKEEEK